MQTATLGPWNDGLNLTSNRDLSVFLKPTELGEATNVVYTKEGFIQPRPGCKVLLKGVSGIYDHATGEYRIDILGNIKISDGRLVVIIQVRNETGAWIYKAYDSDNVELYFNVPADTWFNHVIIHEGGLGTPTPGQPQLGHQGIIFFAEQDYKTYITDDYSLSTPPVIVSNQVPDPTGEEAIPCSIPGSSGGMIVKGRLFLWKYETSTFMWSPANRIMDWSKKANKKVGTDIATFTLIEPTTAKDGIMAVTYLNNNFYIFKKNKTFMYTYQSLPIEDGYLRKINNEMGAFDATMYRNQVVVINNRGVFRINVTEFVDIQSQLDLRFELPLDHSDFTVDDIFITDFNNDILIGFIYTGGDHVAQYHYCMNGYTGAWSKWDYDYNEDEVPKTTIASPGTRQFRSQNLNTTYQYMFFTTFDHKHIVNMHWKPRDYPVNLGHYHSDSNIDNRDQHERMYIPSVRIKTSAAFGNSSLDYKKVYRTYMRFYLSEEPTDLTVHPEGLWTLSINYNDYRFGVDTSHEQEQLLFLYPYEPILPVVPQSRALGSVSTAVYKRSYQLPIHQFRALEFVFELKRQWSTTVNNLVNPDVDEPPKPIKTGYYFMLSGIFYDYEDRARL